MNRQDERRAIYRGGCLLLALLLLLPLGGCQGLERYTYDFYDSFDTMTRVAGYARSQEEFQAFAQAVRERMAQLHRLLDVYNEYEGMNNLKTVNDRAGIAPVEVDSLLAEFLQQCVDWHDKTNGAVNVAMGPVTSLWNAARQQAAQHPETAAPPDADAIKAALALCDIRDVRVDMEESTICLVKAGMSLDVGAIAKGYAVERVAQEMEAQGGAVQDFLISAGGNVRVSGRPAENGRSDWLIGVQAPRSAMGETAGTLAIASGSAVTSGDYQRYFEAEGIRYAHIIDPDTGYPALRYQSVTAMAEDSSIADALSTALFILPLEEGKALLRSIGGEAIWIDIQGEIHGTDAALALWKKTHY